MTQDPMMSSRVENEIGDLREQCDELREQLAKMPRTPDGTLVVLGVTKLYCRAIGGGLGVGVPHSMTAGIGHCGKPSLCITAIWHFSEVKLSNDRHWQLSQQLPLDWCYGSESELLNAEVTR